MPVRDLVICAKNKKDSFFIRAFTLPPGTDPQQLIEEPFNHEGRHYTLADIVKEENQVSDRRCHIDTAILDHTARRTCDHRHELN